MRFVVACRNSAVAVPGSFDLAVGLVAAAAVGRCGFGIELGVELGFQPSVGGAELVEPDELVELDVADTVCYAVAAHVAEVVGRAVASEGEQWQPAVGGIVGFDGGWLVGFGGFVVSGLDELVEFAVSVLE